MKRKHYSVMAAGLAATILFAAGCGSSVKVTTQHDETVDFADYGSYAWVPEPEGEDRAASSFVFRYIKQAISDEMAARELEFDESNPDVLVAYHAAVNQQITGATIDHWGYGRGRYGGGWGTSTASVNSYNEGTMVIDVIDAQRNELVWRGVANGAVDKPESAQEKIPETVAKLLADFPPGYEPAIE